MILTSAYVAGLMDGEGCISISRSGKNYAPRIDLGMTRPAIPVMKALQEQWGGHLSKQRDATDKWAEAWRWCLDGKQCRPFLEFIRDDLRMKRQQAELGLALCDLRDSLVKPGGVKARWTPEASRQALLMKDRMRELNAKGPQEPESEPGWIARLVFSGDWPASGSLRNGRVYALPTLGRPTVESGGSSLPTPRANAERSSRASMVDNRQWSAPSLEQAVEIAAGILPREFESWDEVPGRSGRMLPTPRSSDGPKGGPNQTGDGLQPAVKALLPTPAVNDMGEGKTPEKWDAWTDKMRAKHGNGNGHGKSLAIEAQRLLPTPTAMDSKASGGTRPSDVTLTDAMVRGKRLPGATTAPPSNGGNTSSDDPPRLPLTSEDD